MYLEYEGEAAVQEDNGDENFISLTIKTRVNQLCMRMDKIETVWSVLEKCSKTFKQATNQVQVVNQKSLVKKLTDIIEKRCNHLKQVLEEQMQDMGKAMMDSLKRGDNQLKSMICSAPNAVSTPIALQAFAMSFQDGQVTSTSHPIAAVKLQFHVFGCTDGEDPITYLERCDEYLAV